MTNTVQAWFAYIELTDASAWMDLIYTHRFAGRQAVIADELKLPAQAKAWRKVHSYADEAKNEVRYGRELAREQAQVEFAGEGVAR